MSLREELERRRMAKNADSNDTERSAKPANAAPAQISGADADERPASSPPTPSMPPLFLCLVKTNKQRWLLPWACFHGVSYEPSAATTDDAEKLEQLHLVFMRHDVTVRGKNLAGVVDAIEETNLRELCEVAEKYQAVADTNASLIAVEIEVKVR